MKQHTLSKPSLLLPPARATAPAPEALEARVVPAAVFTFTEADGDIVTVSTSLGTNADLAAGITLGAGNEFIASINLNAAIFSGTDLTVTSKTGGTVGDGFINVGEVQASVRDIGRVVIDGDLGRIRTGDADEATIGLKSLSVRSLGKFDTSTGAPDLESRIDGNAGSIVIKTDLRAANLLINDLGASGNVGSIIIGGSIIGAAALDSGRIFAEGKIGFLSVGGSIQGSNGSNSGGIFAGKGGGTFLIKGSVIGDGVNSGMIEVQGDLKLLRIGGSIVGGNLSAAGSVEVSGNLGSVVVIGSVLGGTGANSGRIETLGGTIGAVTIGGDLVGGSAFASGRIESDTGVTKSVVIKGSIVGVGDASGAVTADGFGKIMVGRDIRGGATSDTGYISAGVLGIGQLMVGGSVIGGLGDTSGTIYTSGTIGNLRLLGDLVGAGIDGADDLSVSGYIRADRIINAFIGGSIIAGQDFSTGTLDKSGSIRVFDDIGKLVVKGQLIGNATHSVVISAGGLEESDNRGTIALGSVFVGGSVQYARILAGYDINMNNADADASIGLVRVLGDWRASDVVAGIDSVDGQFGNNDDVLMLANDDATLTSRIASIIIGGQIVNSTAVADFFGFVAQNLGKVSVGGRAIPLVPGTGNDVFFLGTLADLRIREVL